MENINSGIYQIRNTIDNKVYIGSSKDFTRRWREHRSDLRGNRHHSQYLQNSWNKYGEDNFKFESIFVVFDKDKLIDVEQIFLDNLHPEYNTTYDARVPVNGMEISDETRKKLSKLQTGKNNSFYGKKHTEESKRKISAWSSKQKWTSKRKVNFSKIRMGENNKFAKLTWDKVREIRKLYKTGKYTHNDIGKMFEVHRATISYITLNKTWKE